MRTSTPMLLPMQALCILLSLTAVGCTQISAERQLLDPAAAGLSHPEQVAFLDRAEDQVARDSVLCEFRGWLRDAAGYSVTARAMRSTDISSLAEGGLSVSGLGPLPDTVVAVMWGHPIESSYWLVYRRDGEYLGAFVLPEG